MILIQIDPPEGSPHPEISDKDESQNQYQYRVDEFVEDAINLKITPFMLDSFAHEYHDLVKAREAHATEMDNLRNNNRQLSSQV